MIMIATRMKTWDVREPGNGLPALECYVASYRSLSVIIRQSRRVVDDDTHHPQHPTLNLQLLNPIRRRFF